MTEQFIDDILAETDAKPADAKPAVETPAIEKPAEVDPLVDGKVVTDEKPAESAVPAKLAEPAKPAEPTKPEVTVEDLAIKIGWNPNYKGENSIDATTYILKSREIQDTMHDQNTGLKDQLTNMQGSVDALKEHNERVYKSDVRKMQGEIETLKNEKRAAVELADVGKVDAIDKQIDDLEKDLTVPTTKPTETTNPVYADWVKDNQWYLTEPEMATYAESVAQQYQGAPLERIYSLIRQRVAEVFPDKFESPASAKAAKPVGPSSPVEAPTNSGPTPTFTSANLTPDQTAIMNQFVKTGVMTEKQYINDIANMQEA